MNTILNNINVDAIVVTLDSIYSIERFIKGFSFNSKDKLDMTMGLTDTSTQTL